MNERQEGEKRVERGGGRDREKEKEMERGRERGNEVVPDKAVSVPNPLRFNKALCEIEREEVLPYPRNLSIWNQRECILFLRHPSPI